jgi:transposase InsO family protein
MAQKVAGMDVRMAAAMAGGVPNVAAFCRAQAISRETFYFWQRRFRAEGLPGLQERSRRPRSNPGQTPGWVEDWVVRARKELADEGWDHGSDSIRARLAATAAFTGTPPGRATIWRILLRHGLVTPQPQKRPTSSLHRFVYDRPNECWQSDWTAWQLADATPVAIAATMDDHSRYLTGLAAASGHGSVELVWSVMLAGITECGIPARSLTDNGLIYNGKRHGKVVVFDTNLRALGVQTICSRPYHPQTCGKIERSWQTLKKWLTAHDPASSIEELNTQLAQFRDHYNQHRPHRSLKGRTPATAFAATVKARPANRPLPADTITYQVKIRRNGTLQAGPYQIGVGKKWAHQHVHVIHDGDFAAIFAGNTLIRALTIDPTHNYQRLGRPPKPTNELMTP